MTGRSAPHWSHRQSWGWQGIITSRRSKCSGSFSRPGWRARGFLARGSGFSFSAGGSSASCSISAEVTLASSKSSAVCAGEMVSPLGPQSLKLSRRIFCVLNLNDLVFGAQDLLASRPTSALQALDGLAGFGGQRVERNHLIRITYTIV